MIGLALRMLLRRLGGARLWLVLAAVGMLAAGAVAVRWQLERYVRARQEAAVLRAAYEHEARQAMLLREEMARARAAEEALAEQVRSLDARLTSARRALASIPESEDETGCLDRPLPRAVDRLLRGAAAPSAD